MIRPNVNAVNGSSSMALYEIPKINLRWLAASITGNQRRWSSKKMESGLQLCNLDLAPTCTSEQRLELEFEISLTAELRYVVDGEWLVDPTKETVSDVKGHTNNVVVVEDKVSKWQKQVESWSYLLLRVQRLK